MTDRLSSRGASYCEGSEREDGLVMSPFLCRCFNRHLQRSECASIKINYLGDNQYGDN